MVKRKEKRKHGRISEAVVKAQRVTEEQKKKNRKLTSAMHFGKGSGGLDVCFTNRRKDEEVEEEPHKKTHTRGVQLEQRYQYWPQASFSPFPTSSSLFSPPLPPPLFHLLVHKQEKGKGGEGGTMIKDTAEEAS